VIIYWTARQYLDSWDGVYSQCDEDTQLQIDHRLDCLLEKGNLSREPISKPVEDGIFELRAKDARFMFYFAEPKEIIFVHAIIKKRRDIPKNDIKTAKKRRDDIKLLGLNTNAISN
jgi:phage-related protein